MLLKKRIIIAVGLSLILVGCSGGGNTPPSKAPIDTTPVDTPPEVVLPDYVPYDAPPISDADKAAYLKATNDARAVEQDCGSYGIYPPVPALVWSDELYKASYEHSVDMGVVGEDFNTHISHVGSGGESDWTAQVLDLEQGSRHWERTANNGFDNKTRRANGENAQAGASFEELDIAMQRWIDSDGHCSLLMDPNSKYLGLAVVENQDAKWVYYWTQVFGADISQ